MANTVSEGVTLEMFQLETASFTFTITDDAGDAVDLSGATLRFVVQDSNEPPTGVAKEEEGDIDMTQAGSGIITVSVGSPASDDASSELHYRLWNITDTEVLAHGPFRVKPAVKDVP